VTGDDGVRVRVSPELFALTRANTLGHLAREIVSALNPDEYTLDTILRGIQLSLLEQVKLVLFGKSKKVVGYLAIRIDWNKHAMYLETSGSNTFNLDPAQPITRQLSPLLAEATAYIAAVRERLGVQSVEAFYTYRRDKKEEGRKILRTSRISDKDRRDLRTAQTGRLMEVTDSAFSELTVEFRYQD
jgi:hypothetical protein